MGRTWVVIGVLCCLSSATAADGIGSSVQPGSQWRLDARGSALSHELESLWTRDPGNLVFALEEARLREGSSFTLTFLLAIAHAETNGRIALVSEAGAVGLAQTTPIALLEEGFCGPLFITDDYIRGAMAYFLKKPLRDAEVIAEALLEDEGLQRSRHLLDSAWKVRTEGVEDLRLLVPYADIDFWERVTAADEANRQALLEVERLMENGSKSEIDAFHELVGTRYRMMMDEQRILWKRYQLELVERRDSVLRAHFDASPADVLRRNAWESTAILAAELDQRFSPWEMARFLVLHLERKLEEARRLGTSPEKLERMTAGLYNGGGHNIKRMMSGLIRWLPETERYMEKVPATRVHLDRRLEYEGEPWLSESPAEETEAAASAGR